ncbi:threonylcarbamoyl-AMP synthase [Spirochaetia bacterium]|nr:threonylcarbamoyl-AMP synthase [Spirochaetia bacterium]
MIEYVIPGNIDTRVLDRGAQILQSGGLVALPTDTSWSLCCSLKSRTGLKKLRHLSGERDERHFTLLCQDISQFGEFCHLDNTRFRVIKRLTPGPYVFILKTLGGTEKSLGLRRRELGVRIPAHSIPLELIKTLEAPLYSVTAKRKMTSSLKDTEDTIDDDFNKEEFPPIQEDELFEGGWEMEDIRDLDLILDGGEERPLIFSTVLDMSADEIVLLRRGAGIWPA